MTQPVTWHTAEPCPVCQAPLTLTDTGPTVTETCADCGWSATWLADLDGGSR